MSSRETGHVELSDSRLMAEGLAMELRQTLESVFVGRDSDLNDFIGILNLLIDARVEMRADAEKIEKIHSSQLSEQYEVVTLW